MINNQGLSNLGSRLTAALRKIVYMHLLYAIVVSVMTQDIMTEQMMIWCIGLDVYTDLLCSSATNYLLPTPGIHTFSDFELLLASFVAHSDNKQGYARGLTLYDIMQRTSSTCAIVSMCVIVVFTEHIVMSSPQTKTDNDECKFLMLIILHLLVITQWDPRRKPLWGTLSVGQVR